MPEFDIVTGYLPGLVGRVTELHAIYYAREWGFGAFFETRVATELSQFVGRYDVQRDRIWSAMVDDRIEASLTIDGLHGAECGAHLRWFIAADAASRSGARPAPDDRGCALLSPQALRADLPGHISWAGSGPAFVRESRFSVS